MSMTMVGHTIVEISLEGEYVKAVPNEFTVTPGDTLQIHSTGGKHRVEFKPWPFQEEEQKNGIVTDAKFTFVKSGNGDFHFFCYFTPDGGKEHKYRKGTNGKPDGGHGSVRP